MAHYGALPKLTVFGAGVLALIKVFAHPGIAQHDSAGRLGIDALADERLHGGPLVGGQRPQVR